ncbi:MAG: acetate--CoA ligase family protein, partial [Candidatus Dormibacteraeota bacterium]|nr:acetate--CoA ligase family protein [Candidatus Dormibacteraeota bacterium]
RRPVALKAFGSGLTARRSLGAVALDLRSRRAVQRAAREMRNRLTGAGYAVSGFTIQPMVRDADQLIVGVTQDPVFGPVLACGHAEASEPLVRLTPITETEADDVVLRLGGSPALRDLVLRVSALVEDLPEVVELDLEPVLVNEEGAFVGDASLRVEVRAPQPPLEARVRRY